MRQGETAIGRVPVQNGQEEKPHVGFLERGRVYLRWIVKGHGCAKDLGLWVEESSILSVDGYCCLTE